MSVSIASGVKEGLIDLMWKKARPTQGRDVVGHSESIRTPRSLTTAENRGIRQRQRLRRDFTELIPCTQPDDFSLVIHFQTIFMMQLLRRSIELDSSVACVLT